MVLFIVPCTENGFVVNIEYGSCNEGEKISEAGTLVQQHMN
jgi:hypothetical protein